MIVLISLGGVFEFYDLFFTAYVAPAMVESGLFTPASLGLFAGLGVVAVASFIGAAMLVVIFVIGAFGPRTRDLALEQIAH